MPDTDDTDPGAPAHPAAGPPTETLESLEALRTLEQQRLAREAADERARQAAAEREREEAAQREREAAAERERQAKAEAEQRRREETAAAERAKLLDVEQRLKDQEQTLRAEFELERTRLEAELEHAQTDSASLGSWLTSRGLIAAIAFALLLATGAWFLKRGADRSIVAAREHATAAERERCAAQLKPLRELSAEHALRIGQIERGLADARERTARAETRAQELEAAAAAAPARAGGPQRVAQRKASPGRRQRLGTPAIPSMISDDPLGPLADDPPEERQRPKR